MPVTYNTRFYFVFMTDAGREMRINIKQAGFSGTAVQRPMGATPVLKRDSGGNGIYGTSLEITAECNTDNEFAVLYTSDAKEFLVELVDEDADETLWTGFVSPELYSAPEIAPPYDVRIVAVDGLGELKRDNFAAAGRQSLYTHLSTILSHSGLGAAQSDIVIVDTLACTTPSVSAGNILTGISVDLDYMADEGSTCYEVLEAILETLNLTITRHANKWLLMRPSDVEVSGGAVAAHTAAGTSVSLPAVTYGSMSVTDWWPVGEMATEIQPARNRISVALPYRPSVSMFNDGNLVDPTAWTSWQVTWKEINGVGGEKRPWITQSAGYVSQTIAVQWFDGALPLRVLLASPQDADHEVAVSIVVELQGSSHTYYLSQRNANYLRWNTDRTNIDITLPPLSGYAYPIVPLDKFSLFEYIIDGIPESGQLSIQISAHYQTGIGDPPVVVGLVSLQQQTVYGYKDDIVIDNGARGAGDDAVMAFGDAPYAQNAVRAIRNVTSASGNVTSEWETARFEGGLLEVVAMERALDVALPRQLTKGTLNVPFGAALPAVIVNPDGLAMQIERYSWRLVDDEVEVELLSVPSGNVEIVSDSVTPMTEQEAARATGSSTSGGGGASPSPGGGGDQFFEAVNDPTTQEIVGAKALYDLHIIQTAADPEATPPVAEVTKNVTDILKHLTLQVVNAGTASERTVLVSDIDFASMLGVTAGGIGTDEGGGGGYGVESITTRQDGTIDFVFTGGDITTIDLNHKHQGLLPDVTATDNGKIMKVVNGAWSLATESGGSGTLTGITMNGSPVPVSEGVAGLTLYVGTTPLQASSHEQGLTGISSFKLTASESLVEWDAVNGAWHFNGNLYADGWVSAGGIGNDSSGGYGVESITTRQDGTIDFVFTGGDITTIDLNHKHQGLLPDVTASDNGKIMQVVNGAWATATMASVPTFYVGTSDPSNALGNDGDVYLKTAS